MMNMTMNNLAHAKNTELEQNAAPREARKNALFARLEHAQAAPCFILAPAFCGQDELLATFVSSRGESTLVSNYEVTAQGHCSCVAREQAASLKPQAPLGEQQPSLCLALISSLPWLDDGAAQRFSRELDTLIEEGASVVVCCPVQNDRYQNLQSDRIRITAQELRQNGFFRPPLYASCLDAFLECFLPLELRLAAVLTGALGSATVEDFARLGYELSPGTLQLLSELNPLFTLGHNGEALYAEPLDLEVLTPLLCIVLGDYLKEQGLSSNIPAVAGRIIALSVLLLERGELELSHQILALGEELINKGLLEPRGSQSKQGHSSVAHLHYKEKTPLLRIQLFGELEIHQDDVLLKNKHLARTKIKRLLAFLALNQQRVVSRENLISYLWPYLEEERAQKNLYTSWCLLAKGLGSQRIRECPYIERSGELYQLNSDLVTCDTRQFEEIVRTVLFGGLDRDDAEKQLVRLEDLYRNSLVADLASDSFIKGKMQSYRSLMVDALLSVARMLRDGGVLEKALFYAREAFELDGSREDVYRDLMDIQFMAGQRTSAMQTYFSCKRYLSDELGILPSKSTTALYQDLLLDNCRYAQ